MADAKQIQSRYTQQQNAGTIAGTMVNASNASASAVNATLGEGSLQGGTVGGTVGRTGGGGGTMGRGMRTVSDKQSIAAAGPKPKLLHQVCREIIDNPLIRLSNICRAIIL